MTKEECKHVFRKHKYPVFKAIDKDADDSFNMFSDGNIYVGMKNGKIFEFFRIDEFIEGKDSRFIIANGEKKAIVLSQPPLNPECLTFMDFYLEKSKRKKNV